MALTAQLLVPAAEKSRPKPDVLVFPSGREYEVSRKLTQAEVDQVAAYEASLVERSKRGEYLGIDSLPMAKPNPGVFERTATEFKRRLSGKKQPEPAKSGDGVFSKVAKELDDRFGPGGHMKRELEYYDRIRPGDPRATGEEGIPVVDEANVRSNIRAKTDPGKTLSSALGTVPRAVLDAAEGINQSRRKLGTSRDRQNQRETLGGVARDTLASSVGAVNNPIDVLGDPEKGWWDKTMAVVQIAGVTGVVVSKLRAPVMGFLKKIDAAEANPSELFRVESEIKNSRVFTGSAEEKARRVLLDRINRMKAKGAEREEFGQAAHGPPRNTKGKVKMSGKVEFTKENFPKATEKQIKLANQFDDDEKLVTNRYADPAQRDDVFMTERDQFSEEIGNRPRPKMDITGKVIPNGGKDVAKEQARLERMRGNLVNMAETAGSNMGDTIEVEHIREYLEDARAMGAKVPSASLYRLARMGHIEHIEQRWFDDIEDFEDVNLFEEFDDVLKNKHIDPNPNQRVLTAEEALQKAAEEYQRGAAPKVGGLGSKRAGAARMSDPVDVILGVADATKPGRKLAFIKRGIASLVGNTFDQIKSLGGHGPRIAKELEKVLIDAEAMTATRGFKLKDAVRANFGRVPGLKLSGRKTLGMSDDASEALVTKIEKNHEVVKAGRDIERRIQSGAAISDAEKETLKAYHAVFDGKERRVWDEWVKINDEIAEDGRRFGVLVDRVVDGSKVQHLKGESVEWIVDGRVNRGKIIDGSDEGLKIEVDGKTVTLDVGEHFQTRSLADPETYFPRELKPGVLEKLRSEGSDEFKQLAEYLIEKGKAQDLAQSRAIIKRMMNPVQTTVAGPAQSRLRIARLGVLLPDEFYNRNFLEVAERHIARSALDIASAKIWGPQSRKLGELLDDMVSGGDSIAANAKIKAAFGRDPLGAIDGPGKAIVATEGLVQAVTKLTGVLTGIRQASQFASSASILGGRAVAKGFFDAAKSLVTGRARLDMVKLSGVIDQDVLSLVGFDDLPGISKAIANVALTPVRAIDRTLRVHGALSGIAAFEDAIKRLKFVEGKIKRDATFRLLEDWFDFTEDDIIRIAKGEKTTADIRQAMAGGVKTQVRVRPVDLPTLAANPTGRMIMRLQTFNYGQARIFGWTIKEASKGNAVPLLRMFVAAGVVGEGLVDVIDEIKRRLNNEKRPPRWTELKKVHSFEDGAARAFDNMMESGSFGLYGVPIDAVRKPYARPLPPAVNSIINLAQSIAYGSASEKEFLKKLEAAGMEMGTKEVVVWGQLYKATHKGKTYREQNPKPDKR